MKKVYDYFCEYYGSLIPGDATEDDVLNGIQEYLESIGVENVPLDETEAERIAAREMGRFKLMPKEYFESFFRCYSAKQKVEALVLGCERNAMDRALNDHLLQQDECDQRIQCFFELTKPLLNEKSLKQWILECEETMSQCLTYASGKTDAMPEYIEERLIFGKQEEQDEIQ